MKNLIVSILYQVDSLYAGLFNSLLVPLGRALVRLLNI